MHCLTNVLWPLDEVLESIDSNKLYKHELSLLNFFKLIDRFLFGDAVGHYVRQSNDRGGKSSIVWVLDKDLILYCQDRMEVNGYGFSLA